MTGLRSREYLHLVIEADAGRLLEQGTSHSRDYEAPRSWIELPFNVLGNCFGMVMWMTPWPLRRRWAQWINVKLCAHSNPNAAELPKVQAHAVRLVKEIYEKTGEWPAFMVFTSHPDTTGPLEWLRFELFRQGLWIADAIVEQKNPGHWFRSHPQCFIAIDPFALDTLSPAIAGFYAGWMHRLYLAWDRQAATQLWLQRHWLLRGSGYPDIVHKLLQRLKENIPVIMVIAGGLPHNARLLYTTREFIHRMPVRQWPMSKKEASLRMMEIVRNPVAGERPTEKGELPAPVRAALAALWGELGIPEIEHGHWFEVFQKEFRLEVPYRTRLFHLLTERIVRKGKPLVWAALAHRDEEPYIRVSEPWAALLEKDGSVNWGSCAGDGHITWQPLTSVDAMASEFAKEFTAEMK